MPILPLEPFVFPDTLFTNPAAAEEPLRWWALHVKPRAEKSLARTLLDRGLPFFLPLWKKCSRNRGRVLTSHVPLFPGYLFLRGDDQARVQALTTNYIVRTLHVEDQAELQADLARVYHLMASGAVLSPEERLRPGTRVEITAGPFAGIEGKIIRRGHRLKFFVEVHFLQRGVSVEIDSWMIEPIPEGRRATGSGD
jgi:transcriptional antiterminator RfaH